MLIIKELVKRTCVTCVSDIHINNHTRYFDWQIDSQDGSYGPVFQDGSYGPLGTHIDELLLSFIWHFLFVLFLQHWFLYFAHLDQLFPSFVFVLVQLFPSFVFVLVLSFYIDLFFIKTLMVLEEHHTHPTHEDKSKWSRHGGYFDSWWRCFFNALMGK